MDEIHAGRFCQASPHSVSLSCFLTLGTNGHGLAESQLQSFGHADQQGYSQNEVETDIGQKHILRSDFVPDYAGHESETGVQQHPEKPRDA